MFEEQSMLASPRREQSMLASALGKLAWTVNYCQTRERRCSSVEKGKMISRFRLPVMRQHIVILIPGVLASWPRWWSEISKGLNKDFRLERQCRGSGWERCSGRSDQVTPVLFLEPASILAYLSICDFLLLYAL